MHTPPGFGEKVPESPPAFYPVLALKVTNPGGGKINLFQ
jgi:hypothetical protein